MRFKILSGGYFQNNRLYKRGDTVETDSPLDEMFNVPGGEKYKRLDSFASNVDPEQLAVGADKGELVNSEFDFSPEDTGMHIYKQGKKYFAYDVDNLEVPMNEEGLTKAKMNKFIASQYEG